MRILLVDPPFHRLMKAQRYYYPLGLAYLAAVLEQAGHHVSIYDAECSPRVRSKSWIDASQQYDAYVSALEDDRHPVWDECREVIGQFQPQIVGISALSVKSPAALKVAHISKVLNPESVVVVGADHPTSCPEEFLHDASIDFVIRGEGELSLKELVDCLGRDRGRLSGVPGLSFRNGSHILHNPGALPIEHLDQIPFPSRSALLNHRGYRPVDFGLMVTSRGCPYRCTFCGVSTLWGRKVRFRSVDNVFAEMKQIHDTYGTSYFSFRDPCFTLNRDRVIGLCQRILNERLDVRWECLTRSNLLDEELVENMKTAGCDMVRLGIESGSQAILDYLHKGTTLESIRSGVALLRRHSMRWSAYFMFGVPAETRQTLAESIAFMKELAPDFITVARFTPIPGTELYRDCARRGLIREPLDWKWECNQNIKTCFVDDMTPQEFSEAMLEIAQFADEHNRAHGWVDQRWQEPARGQK